MSEPGKRLMEIMQSYMEGIIDSANFCEKYEKEYNFSVAKAELSPSERRVFADLFDKIVWYSPFESERKVITNYIGEEQVKTSVASAIAALGF